MTILITGGTGLVASAQVKYFLTQGHRVVVTYRSGDASTVWRREGRDAASDERPGNSFS